MTENTNALRDVDAIVKELRNALYRHDEAINALYDARTRIANALERIAPATAKLYEQVVQEARAGCWCRDQRKPCPYHEGYEDGVDATLTALEKGSTA